MSGIVRGLSLLEAAFGYQATEPAKNLPQAATGDIFTVAGGRVILTSLIGQVTTAIGSTSCTLSVGVAPAGGTASVAGLAAASTSIASLAVGTLLAVPAAAAALVLGGSGTGLIETIGASLLAGPGLAIVSPGFITITTSADDNGQIQWTCSWIPFDSGATVTAV